MFAKMHSIYSFLLVLCIAAHFPITVSGQEYPYETPPDPCDRQKGMPDTASLLPHETITGVYVFTYWNSEFHCSGAMNMIELTAPDGFTVFVYVDVSIDEQNRERIHLQVPQFYTMVPHELILLDGEEGEIQIFQGLM